MKTLRIAMVSLLALGMGAGAGAAQAADSDMSKGDMDEADFQAETAILLKKLDMDSNNDITPSEVEAAHDNGQLKRTMEGNEDGDPSAPPAHGAIGSTISPSDLQD